jgi:DNA adenine methylase
MALTMEPIPPPMKAVGGKRRIAVQLANEIMAFKPDLYVEPFVGGGAVTLALPVELPKIIADTNPAIVAVWLALKRWPDELNAALIRARKAHPNTAFGYAQARDQLNHLLGMASSLTNEATIELAAYALWINSRCFNGLWRTNSSGQFNVFWGKYKSPRDIGPNEIAVYAHTLKTVDVKATDFRVTFNSIMRRNDRIVIFADSPYDGTFANYTAEKFDDTDQAELAQWLRWLVRTSRGGIKVFATNADTPRVRELYNWTKIEVISEQHSVGPTGAQRGKRGCVLIRA